MTSSERKRPARRLGPTQLAILAMIAENPEGVGRLALPRTLARTLRCTEETVMSAVYRLQRDQVIRLTGEDMPRWVLL